MREDRKQAPEPHPDWFWSMSGGIDSVAAFLTTKDIGENYAKKPVAVYFDTRIGAPLNRSYLEELADRFGIQLWTIRTECKFEDQVKSNGCPGAGRHSLIRDRLKGRQASKINTIASDPIHIIGLRAEESEHRASLPKVVEKKRHRQVYPVHRLTQRDCVEIILSHEECPINPLWLFPEVIKDCGCLANGDPSELDKTEELFPWFAQRLREIEEMANVEETDKLKGTLGWDGLTADERSVQGDGIDQSSLCSSGCGRERDPEVVQALVSVVNGTPRDEAIATLRESEPPKRKRMPQATLPYGPE